MASALAATKRDVIAIIGTTGVGKTQLSLDIAEWLKSNTSGLPRQAEVVNADSMQVYRGQDIITNKASHNERQTVPHHLMDFLEVGQDYRVDRFRRDALATINAIHSRDAIPLIVGGTMYFIQHLLFPGRLVSAQCPRGELDRVTPSQSPPAIAGAKHQLTPDMSDLLAILQDLPSVSTSSAFPPDFPIQRLPAVYRTIEAFSAALYAILQAIDPAMAEKWHWKDIRKVRRSIEVVLQTGRRHSEIMAEQHQYTAESEFRTLFLWPHAEQALLDARLDKRVDSMLERGLVSEVQSIHNAAQRHPEFDLTTGIFQVLEGYKGFVPYLAQCASGVSGPSLDSSIDGAVEQMKIGTRQYARRQVKWIRNKLMPVINEQEVAALDAGSVRETFLYALDATDPSEWHSNVKQPALDAVEAFLLHRGLPPLCDIHPGASSLLAPAPKLTATAKIRCDICTVDPARPVLLQSGEPLRQHNQTRSHRKRLKKYTVANTSGWSASVPDDAATRRNKTTASDEEGQRQEERPP